MSQTGYITVQVIHQPQRDLLRTLAGYWWAQRRAAEAYAARWGGHDYIARGGMVTGIALGGAHHPPGWRTLRGDIPEQRALIPAGCPVAVWQPDKALAPVAARELERLPQLTARMAAAMMKLAPAPDTSAVEWDDRHRSAYGKLGSAPRYREAELRVTWPRIWIEPVITDCPQGIIDLPASAADDYRWGPRVDHTVAEGLRVQYVQIGGDHYPTPRHDMAITGAPVPEWT